MEIDYITDQKGSEMYGMPRYQKEIHERLENVKLNIINYACLNIKIKGIGIGIINRYLKYPYMVRRKVKEGNVKHIAFHELAYLLELIKLEKTVVTCYDLIPWVYEKNHRSLLWRLLYRLSWDGLRKADRIITISAFSKNEIIKYLGYPEDKIHVIYPAVNHSYYYEKRDREILKRFNISEDEKIILYVGSEQPRKNLPFLIRAFGKLKRILPEAKLLKIGNPLWRGAREENLRLIGKLNLQNDVIFVGYVDEEELPKWYNAADLFVFPSLYEGFGLPPLEAMACGTPVITSNASSLPEVVGDAGIIVDSFNTDEMVRAMYEVLTNDGLREDMSKRGLKMANMFSWEKAAEETLEVYEERAQ